MSWSEDTGERWRQDIDGERRSRGRRSQDQVLMDAHSIIRRLSSVEAQQLAMARADAAQERRLEALEGHLSRVASQVEGVRDEVAAAHAFLRGVAWVGGTALTVWGLIGEWVRRELTRL